MISDPKDRAKLVTVGNEHPEAVEAFLNISKDYFSDIPADKRERFVQSIIDRQGEANRWLLLLRYEGEYIGFVHIKIGGERPGWGVILEFFIVPNKRRHGWGRWLFNRVVHILQTHGVDNIWLWSASDAEPFWYSLGFQETGEIENGMKVMVKSV
ncbi:MAG: GNAT family N-acetyltransferase [Candidatus Thorarchaeota archaeon]